MKNTDCLKLVSLLVRRSMMRCVNQYYWAKEVEMERGREGGDLSDAACVGGGDCCIGVLVG